MADVENLEKLSNSDIRLKCIELGLPNVPVTDFSRKLMIKRLNDTIKNTAPKDNAKASNRRETINTGKAAAPEVEMPKTRRTISAVTSVSAKEDNAPTAIPIPTRRRSVQKDSNESTKPTKTIGKPTQTILIEDDEDDIALMHAADNAEKASTTSSVPIENITGRRKSRSVSVPKVTEIITTVTAAAKKRAMTPLAEEKPVVVQHELPAKNAKPQISRSEDIVNIVSVQSLSTLESPVALTQQSAKATVDLSSHYSKQNTTPSVYSTPSSMRFTAGSGLFSNIAAADTNNDYLGSSSLHYRSKKIAESLLNEVSDTDVANDDDCRSPFLSNFARDLERRRSIGRTSVGTSYSQYVRRSGGSMYENSAIRGRRPKADVSIGQIVAELSRKYHLKTIFYLLVLLCVSIFIYIYLYA